MPEDHFGEDVAARYDETSPAMFDAAVLDATVDVLADLAGDGAALEFAIGTGRVALPLAARGVPVSGIELSPAMVDRLRAKPGADRIDVTIGDMATTRVAGPLPPRVPGVQHHREPHHPGRAGGVLRQRRRPPRARRLLRHRGRRAPTSASCRPARTPSVFSHTPGYVGYDHYTDLVAQQATSHHFVSAGNHVSETRTPFRYVWPSELDLMARLAGMALRHRWAGWDRSPFTGESTSHVSVWEKV